MNIVVHRHHAGDIARNRGGFIGFLPGVSGSGQMHYAFNGFDADMEGAHFLVGDRSPRCFRRRV